MNITIRKYKKEDYKEFIKLTEDNHRYVSSLDNNKILYVGRNYAKYFAKIYLDKTKNTGGEILIAEKDYKVIGCCVCLIIKSTKEEKEKYKNIKVGRISNLTINKNYRGQGIGKALMVGAEDCLKKEKCKYIKIGVFAPNKNARAMYDKMGYKENSIHLIKKL